jgi:hypothetical protein
MFVRWKTQERWRTNFVWLRPSKSADICYSHKEKYYAGKKFSAVLVRSERVGGKPRQKIVAYLGHINEKKAGVPAQRLYFWKAVGYRLDALSLSPTERQRIEEQIGKVITQPTPEEAARIEQEREALWQRLTGVVPTKW